MLLDKSISNPEDSDFRAFRDEDHLKKQRIFIEELWEKYEPFADSHFKTEITKNFKDRFWEMYLGYSLIKKGFKICSSDKGPDIQTFVSDSKVWIEAVTPSNGSGPDRVPEFPSSGTFPEIELILRFSSVIWDKYKKLKEYLNEGLVDKDDPFIIAINSSKIGLAMSEGYPPYILKTLFPIGNPIYTVDVEKRVAYDERFSYKPDVPKKSGTRIQTLYFENNNYSEITGILYSHASPFFSSIGHDYIYVHNPFAKNPIPLNWLEYGREAYEDNGYINIKNHNSVG